MRDTGGGFGQKVMPCARRCASCSPRRKVPGALKWIEDRRENLLAAGQSRHEHGDVRMAFDADGTIQAADIDFVQDGGAYPTPWPVLTTAAGRHALPRPVPGAQGQLQHKTVYTNTAGRTAYRGPWQFETLAREVLLDIAARQMGIDPVELRRRNLLRRDELPYANPNGMPYDNITPARDVRAGAGDARLRRLPRRAGRRARRRAATSASGSRPTSSRPTPGSGYYGTEGATIRIEPSGKVNVYVAGGSTGNSLETTVVQLTADALGVDIDDVAHDPGRHRGHGVRRRHRRAAAAGR